MTGGSQHAEFPDRPGRPDDPCFGFVECEDRGTSTSRVLRAGSLQLGGAGERIVGQMTAAGGMDQAVLSTGARLAIRYRKPAFALLWFIIFMQGVAGSKIPISWPPTMDPAVACRRPKASTPHPPEPSFEEQLKAVQDPTVPPLLAEVVRVSEWTVDLSGQEDLFESAQIPSVPRYLLPYLRSTPRHHLSPPA